MSGRAQAVRCWLSCGVVVAALVTSAEAEAKPLALELVWNAPQGCPDASQVLTAIHRLTGTTEAHGTPALSVQGEIERRGDSLVLKLVWRTDSMQTERSMESSSCDELARAAALVVALAADPGAAQTTAAEADLPREQQALSAQSPASPRSPAPKPVPSRPSENRSSSLIAPNVSSVVIDSNGTANPAARSSARTRATTRAQFALDLGSLPRSAEGAALGAGLGFGPTTLQAELSLFVPQRKVVAEGAAKLWYGTLAVHPCLAWSLARLRVLPCAALELDLLVGQGEGVDFRQGGAAWFPRFGGGAEFGYSLSKQIAWIANGWLLAGPWRPTFVLQEVVPIHQPSLLVGRWTTGLELRL